MSYGYDRFLFLFINEVPVCYLSFRKDSLFLQETNRTANENSPYTQLGIWGCRTFYQIPTAWKYFIFR